MNTFCVVLHGRRSGAPLDPRLPASFGLAPGAFAETIGVHAPLIVTRHATVEEADARAAQLRAWGADATVFATDGRQRWLQREGRVMGPLPADALAAFAQPGDHWSENGKGDWRLWSPPGVGFVSSMPPASALPPPTRRNSPWVLAVIAATIFLLALAALMPNRHRDGMTPTATSTTPAVPRSATTATPVPTGLHCPKAGTMAQDDDDRQLVRDGERRLAGLPARLGGAYAVLAVVGDDARCRVRATQVFVFRDGALLGPLFTAPLADAAPSVTALRWRDDTHLEITQARCGTQAPCAPAVHRTVELRHDASGWSFVPLPPMPATEASRRDVPH